MTEKINEGDISIWLTVKENLANAKDREEDLRRKICKFVLKTKRSGSKTIKDFGYKIKATGKLNTSLDKDQLKAIWPKLSREEKRCIKFSASLKEKEYKKIPEDSILHTVVKKTPGLPSLEISELEE